MDRRHFVKWLSMGGLTSLAGCSHLSRICPDCLPQNWQETPESGDRAEILSKQWQRQKHQHSILNESADSLELKRDYFERDFPDDIQADRQQWAMVQKMAKRLGAVEAYVGHGNFNILSWDEMIRFGKYAPDIEPFSSAELTFLETLFYFEASRYGFMGKKVFTQLTQTPAKKEFEKVPYSGHFLRKGEALNTYNKLKSDVGETLVLTSGYRGLVKQFHLFLEKCVETKGNFSRASRSLAPPGYSFHGLGDFDVGKVGHGLRNFTYEFAQTDEYKRLLDLGYVGIRYSEKNLLGVRFEPWHIRV